MAVRPISLSPSLPGKSLSIPEMSAKALSSASASILGERVAATSSRASEADLSATASWARAMTSGNRLRACARVVLGLRPKRHAARDTATTRAAVPSPRQMTIAFSANSGSARSRAARGKHGAKRQAMRGIRSSQLSAGSFAKFTTEAQRTQRNTEPATEVDQTFAHPPRRVNLKGRSPLRTQGVPMDKRPLRKRTSSAWAT